MSQVVSTPVFKGPINLVDESGGGTTASIAQAYAQMENAISTWNPHSLDSSAADSMYAVPTGPTDVQKATMLRAQQQAPSTILTLSQGDLAYIAPPVTNAPSVAPLLSQVGTQGGSYNAGGATPTFSTTAATIPTATIPTWIWVAAAAVALWLIMKGN